MIFFSIVCFVSSIQAQVSGPFGVKDDRVDPTTPNSSPLTRRRAAKVPVLKPSIKRGPRVVREFMLPLRFDPEDNGLSIENPQFKYHMMSDDQIDLGGLILESKSIGLALSQSLRDRAPVRFEDTKSKDRYLTALSIQWPDRLAPTGDLSLEGLDGKILWAKTVTIEDIKTWHERLNDATPEMKKVHLSSTWGQFGVTRSEISALYKGVRFRACFTKANPPLEKLRICSRIYGAKSRGDRVRAGPITIASDVPTEPGISLGETKLDRSGLLNFPFSKPILIKIQFADSGFIEIAGRPGDPQLLDVVASSDGSEILLTGSGAKPIGGRTRVLQKPITHFWAPTGIPQDLIWQVALPMDKPTIRVLGSFNIPYTLLFSADRLPRESDRVFVKKTHSSGTYSSNPIVQGYIPSGGMISSDEESAYKTADHFFSWEFAAPNLGAENKARLLVQAATQVPTNSFTNGNTDGQPGAKSKVKDVRPWVAHYQMYRSFPYEISGRLTGILASDFTFIMMGELSAAAWFESIGFTQDIYLSKQRWGVAGRYLKAFSTIKSSSNVSVDDFTTLNLDLKYNILAGVWHRDEMVGAMLNYQQVTLAHYPASMLGAGAYWARTMPRLINDIFNLVPFLEYPKYVDVQLVYFPVSLTSGVGIGMNFNLDFHGRIFFSHRFYGEAGFGIRQIAFSTASNQNSLANVNPSIGAAYGTTGLGFVF